MLSGCGTAMNLSPPIHVSEIKEYPVVQTCPPGTALENVEANYHVEENYHVYGGVRFDMDIIATAIQDVLGNTWDLPQQAAARIEEDFIVATIQDVLGNAWEQQPEAAASFELELYVMAVDLPLSLVADTLTLPVAIWNRWESRRKSQRQNSPERDSELKRDSDKGPKDGPQRGY
jgi:uncharacterized protein YceK